MNIKEENRKYQERVMKMSKDELDSEMVVQVNEIRRKEGLPPVRGIEEARKLLNAAPKTVVVRQNIDDMNFWQRMRYALKI